jgi:predicted dehydrogenase
MRVGVIGTGIAGSSHLFDLASSDHFTIAAVCARRRHRAVEAAQRYGVPSVFDDPADLLAQPQLDAVVIATPPHITPTVTCMALGIGVPVLVDKPAAPTAALLDQVQQVRGATACVIVAYNRRYQRHVHHVRSLLADAEPGTLSRVECEWAGPFTHRYAEGDTYRRSVGWGHGVVLDTASHIVDTLAFLGFASLEVTDAHLTRGPHGADIAARVELRCVRHDAPVSVRITDVPGDETWTIAISLTAGKIALTRTELTGTWHGRPLHNVASDIRRPVDDLIALTERRATLGASLPEAVAVLTLIDQVRDRATDPRPWRRPRAKALGRLNGAC